MKKILYSRAMKIIAVLLVIVYAAIGSYQLTDLVMWDIRSSGVYNFEGSFGESTHVYSLLHSVEWRVDDAYLRPTESEETEGASPELSLSELERSLSALSSEDRIYYYVAVNDRVWTNYGENPDTLCELDYYKKCAVDEQGEIEMKTSLRDASFALSTSDVTGDRITVISALQPAYADGARILWEMEERQFFEHVLQIALTALLFLGFFGYLIAVAGTDRNGEKKSSWVDRVFTEVHMGFLFGTVSLGAWLWFLLVNDGERLAHRIWIPLSVLIGACVGALALTSSLSLVRKIKHGSFLKTSAVVWILKGLWRVTVWLGKAIGKGIGTLRRFLVQRLFKKTAMIFCAILLIYTAVIGFCGILAAWDPVAIVFGVLVFLVGCFFLAYRGADLDRIKLGLRKVREGDFGYRIEAVKSEDVKMMAEDIGGIAEGMERSLAERVRAERMKTELITNVSHDLKTPLTSIISYTELLAGVEGLPEEAKDYVTVISAKSGRLKKLTQDLFDISKAQSGNEEVITERLDASLLIQQALGEYDREITESGLIFCVDSGKELYFNADGRKMSRVVGNLIENVLKYTMAHTRVFIRAEEQEGEIRMEFKNISSYPLNFDPAEIVGRFARGDESRSTEGNGLGLAIAKSYTELCGGTFRVVTDGDLFKVVLTFPEEG